MTSNNILTWSQWLQENDAEQLAGTQCILVQNISQKTSIEKVRLYFENHRRSGGGVIEKVVNLHDGVVIMFQDDKYVQSTLEKVHYLDDTRLKIVSRFIPPLCGDRFLLSNVGKGTSLDTVELLLENCDKPNQRCPELIPCKHEGQYLALYNEPTELYEIREITKEISRNKLEGCALKATLMQPTNALLVEGIPGDSSKENIETFFNNCAHLGKDKVTTVDLCSVNTAVVSFADCQCAESLWEHCKRTTLQMNRCCLKISLYYHHLQSNHSETINSSDHREKTFVEPQTSRAEGMFMKSVVSPVQNEGSYMITSGSDILNYLGFKKLNKNLREEFSERAKISLVVTDDSVYIHYTVKDEDPQSLLEDFDKFFSNFSSQLVSGNEAELSKLRASYNWTEDEEKIEVRIGSTVMHVFVQSTTDGVQITGQMKQVDVVVKEFERLLNSKTVTLPICESYYKRLMKNEALQSSMVNNGKVEVTCNPTDYSVTFTGSAKDVDQAELCFMRKLLGLDSTPVEKQSIATQVENSEFMRDCHVQTELNTVKNCETQTTPMVEETTSTETQTENIAMLMTLDEYEVGVVVFWESCRQLPSLRSKYDVQIVSSKNGNQTIKISSKNAIEFMQEFQSLYNDAKLKMQHKFVHVSERSENPKKQMKVLNDTCGMVHCAFYYDAPNLMVVMGTDNAMLDHCHSQLQTQNNTNANPTQSFGVQISSDNQVEERPVKPAQQNATELPSNISVHVTVEKEYTDTITVDKDVYSYIQLSKANRVKQIWERHQIKIKTTNVGQNNLSIKLTSKDEERIVQAIDEFQSLYQDTMYHIRQANIECEFDLLDNIEKAIDVVRTNNKDVLVCQSSDNKYRVIMLSEDKEALEASRRVFKQCLNSISDKPTQLPKQPSLASHDNYKEVFKFVTKGGIRVSVGNGNIALQDVDAIVNAANKYIENGAGVTGAIFRQGGWEFEQVCQKAMKRRHRPLAVGQVVSVKAAGRLQCKKVLHLVGPQWYKYSNKQEAYQLLESGLLSVLEKSDGCGAFTLALPPVATVVYGTPLNAFVQAMNTALTSFETSYPRSTRVLNYIRILSIDQSTVSILATMFSFSVEKDRSSSVDPSSHHHHTSAQPLGGNDEDIDGGEVPMEIDDVYDGHSSYKYQSNAQQSQQSTSQVTEKKSYAAAAKSSSHDTRAVLNKYENKVQFKQQTDEWKMTVKIFPQTASTESMYHLHISISSLHYQDMYRKTAYIPNVEGAREVIKRIGKLVKAKKLFQLKYSADSVCSCKLKSLAFNMFDIKENYMENLQNELLELEKKEYQKPTEKESEKEKNGKKEQENGKGKESNTEKEDEKEQCAICLDDINGSKIKTLPCKHKFHETCVNQALKVNNLCPICKQAVGKVKGNQPNGTMRDRIDHNTHLPGYERYGAIVIDYNFPSGIQGREHPNPGVRYTSTSRTAYLPDNREGREVLRLLKKAFDARLIFTIGRSVTTGMENQVTWNDIHHKTNPYGGATGYARLDIT